MGGAVHEVQLCRLFVNSAYVIFVPFVVHLGRVEAFQT